jgi:NADPH:quinone reductase-like Zn-dependent oxidoreductase
MSMMKAVVINEPGGPEVLKIESIRIPVPQAGQVLIRVNAFGINRSEMFTRQGHSPGVKFPRVLGIEAAGVVEDAPGGEFRKRDVVATAMGGMGRAFDGGYAEYTCVPANQVRAIQTKLPWEILGAMPGDVTDGLGSLFRSLHLAKRERLLIRGGTTSVGLAAAAIAKSHGASVAATTRNKDRAELLRSGGVDDVIVDIGWIADEVQRRFPEGVDKVLEVSNRSRGSRHSSAMRSTGVIGDSGQTQPQVGCRITVSQFSCSDQVRLGGIVLTDALFVRCRLLPQGAV